MKELSTPDKIRLLEEILRENLFYGLCYKIASKALELEYITDGEYRHTFVTKIARYLIPELLMIKPSTEEDDNGYWFGEPSKENIPARRAALKQLIKIIKSKP